MNSQALASPGIVAPIKILHQQGTLNNDTIASQHQAKAEVVGAKQEHKSASASYLKSVLPADLQ